jgi:uncharacterized membrane protein
MKRILITLFIIMGGIKVEAQTTLRLMNNTDKKVYASYAFYDAENSAWTSIGWYEVEPYNQTDIDLGDYKGKIYIHGKSSAYMGLSEITWGTGYTMCINSSKPFKIINADKINCDTKRNFSETNVSTGITKWTFNP